MRKTTGYFTFRGQTYHCLKTPNGKRWVQPLIPAVITFESPLISFDRAKEIADELQRYYNKVARMEIHLALSAQVTGRAAGNVYIPEYDDNGEEPK